MLYKRNINQYTITDFLFKLSHETWTSVFEGDDVNTVFNAFLNTFLRYYYSSFPMKLRHRRSQAQLRKEEGQWMTTAL